MTLLSTNIWQADPIFSATKIIEDLASLSKIATQQVKQVDPKKNLMERWVDGLFVDKFLDSPLFQNSLVITNNIIQCSAEDKKHIYTVNPTFYGVYHAEYPDYSVNINKDFNCLINRFDIFRQSWVYQLIRRKLFEHGYISFNCEMNLNRIPSNDYKNLSASAAFDLAFEQYNKIFDEEHKIIRNQIPYKNFEDNGDVAPVILSSKFSIVLETFFHDNRVITYSEKIFRCLQLPRPWVLFSTQFAIDNLRKLGFDVLDDIVDHRYDNIENLIERQVAILDQCEILKDLDINSVLQRCQQATLHNKHLLQSMKQNLMPNFKQDLMNAKEQILDL